MKDILFLLRVHQWIKGLFIFAPFFFSFHWTFSNFIKVSIGFILFNLVASSIYIFNDLKDVNEDRLHPIKKHRPIASGKMHKFRVFLENEKVVRLKLKIRKGVDHGQGEEER
jgi:4-hydroxybenzoate polyprenyltransferase